MTSVSTDRRRGINSGAAIKVSCVCATTANITLSGEQTIDDITTSASRVWVKDQTDATENGIYLSGTSTWTREPDFDGTYDVTEGTLVPVSRGTVNAATMWRVTNTGTITIGTTELTISAQSLGSAAILSDGSVSMAADFLPATNATHGLGSKTYQWLTAFLSGGVLFKERSDHSVTPAASYGEVWVKNNNPSQLYYTDDAQTDWPLSSGQVKFPATQNASTDANTLDDYEEGTWTPALTAGSGSITTQTTQGFYTKIGRCVYIFGGMVVTNKGTASGVVGFSGLPVASKALTYGPSLWTLACIGTNALAITAGESLIAGVTQGATTGAIHIYNATTGTAVLDWGEVSNNSQFAISGHYFV